MRVRARVCHFKLAWHAIIISEGNEFSLENYHSQQAMAATMPRLGEVFHRKIGVVPFAYNALQLTLMMGWEGKVLPRWSSFDQRFLRLILASLAAGVKVQLKVG